VLQTLAPNEPYRAGDIGFGEDAGPSLNFSHYIDLLKRRLFYFLLPFGLISVVGMYLAAIQKPSYLSEGKILIEAQRIASDYVRPIITVTASERIQVIQQRLLTRDNLVSIANKFHLFPGRSGVVDLMRESTQIKVADFDVQARQAQAVSATAFTVGFDYENPDLAMRVANELVTLIVDEDERSRTSRATEAVKILTSETRDLEDKLQSTQAQLLEIARRPRDSVSESVERENPQLTALAALKAELIQKTSVYSEAHPAVTALRKRIAAMEKSLTQSGVLGEAKPTQIDEKDALKRQKEALEKRLAEANGKLAAARLSEKLDRDQQSERLQVIESPSLPQKPLKSGRLRLVGIAFGLAAMLGIGSVIAIEMVNGSITSRHQLLGVVDSHLIVSIPYLTAPSDVIRARVRKTLAVFTVVTILTAWVGLSAAIVLQLPVEFFWHGQPEASLSPAR
jgi:uncharacterized protein involved in exopolysaccharide biosynthesis